MTSFVDWFVPSVIGVTFTTLGALKLVGVCRGVVGGGDQPFIKRLCGT
jgi:hypothetical protein